MSTENHQPSTRREFIGHVGQLGMAVAVNGCATMPSPRLPTDGASPSPVAQGEWDLSWIARIAAASDRAVFDMPSIADRAMLDMATRYLDNCDSVYGSSPHRTCVVLNVRTRGVALALGDELWQRFALGVEYDVKDPATQLPATRNPFLEVASGSFPGTGAIRPLVERGALMLVCDFALGHLATRLAAKAHGPAAEVHNELRRGFVAEAYAVPSGIFGLARSQNAGCALVKL